MVKDDFNQTSVVSIDVCPVTEMPQVNATTNYQVTMINYY